MFHKKAGASSHEGVQNLEQLLFYSYNSVVLDSDKSQNASSPQVRIPLAT
jgi:hypothetical protein